jgi:hypothetical protein
MKYLLLFFIGFANIAYGQYSLALNLEKGSSYYLNINSINHFSGEIDGKKMDINTQVNGRMKFTVLKVSALDYELEASYDTIHFALRGPMGQLEFSSGREMQDYGSAQGSQHPVPGKSVHLTLLKNGAVSKIENSDTSGFASIFKNFPMAKMLKELMMGSFKKSFSRHALKENIEKFTAIFPDKKVGLQESWGSVIKPDSNSDNTIKINYTLVSYQSGIAVIKGHTESKAKISHKDSAKGFGINIPEAGDFEGESESTIQVDTKTGWIKDADIKNDLKGQIQIKNRSDSTVKVSPLQMHGDLTLSGN